MLSMKIHKRSKINSNKYLLTAKHNKENFVVTLVNALYLGYAQTTVLSPISAVAIDVQIREA